MNDGEWVRWSGREIARRAGVAHPFVGKLRSSLVTDTSERTCIDNHGNVITMSVANIAADTERVQPVIMPSSEPLLCPLYYRQ